MIPKGDSLDRRASQQLQTIAGEKALQIIYMFKAQYQTPVCIDGSLITFPPFTREPLFTQGT